MGLSDEDGVQQAFSNLCLDLNMDRNTKDDAWASYRRIGTHYALEGNQLHWLACAVYVACRRSVVPTVGHGTVEGNCVSLTQLLRAAKFRLKQFFSKMKKWLDMAALPSDFRGKVDRLERNFAVSTVTFKKYRPIFFDVFNHTPCPARQRSRKQRRMPCTVNDLFAFCWTMFVHVKGNFPDISDDLVNSYHLLLCCIDWFFSCVLIAGRRDLLNPRFAGLPENFSQRDCKQPAEIPCIIKLLCDKHNGLVVEAKTIKEHHWKPNLKKLFHSKRLKGNESNLSGVLDTGNFEANSKAINNAYEEYVLNIGDFDERIFLGGDAGEEIGTPRVFGSDFSDGFPATGSMQHAEINSLVPSTPLTGRSYLKEKDPSITPVSTATQSVSRLQALLSGCKTCPSEELLELFNECSRNPKDAILIRVKEMGELFCSNFVQPSADGHPGSQTDFAKKRLQLAESLYYKVLVNIIVNEKKTKDGSCDLSGMLEQDLFQRALFACCLEIVIFSYNSQRTFPWIVEIFDLSPFHFYRVIEIIIRAEESLSRDVVKHLNHIEESILENFAWKSLSPLWDATRDMDIMPTCEEVSLPSQIESGMGSTSPPIHPAVRRLVDEGRPSRNSQHSPSVPSVTERFSPNTGTAKRKLFSSGSSSANQGSENQVNNGKDDSTPVMGTHIITFQQAQTEDGRPVLISVQTAIVPNSTSGAASAHSSKPSTPNKVSKPKRTGSLGLFFRKVYHLASVRLRDLGDRLKIEDEDLRRKMWTCFEYTLVHHIDLIMDRHLDQIIMCAIYAIAKVSADHPQSFQNIMKCYRLQPQAQSHVYRSVLLNSRRRRTSGSSDSSKNGASGSSSPVMVEREDPKDKEKKRAEKLNIRSSSTLPVPHPNSQPPTPTKLIGMGATFDFGEKRGDLIKFYNLVFVKKLKDFAMKFSNNQSGEHPTLSPLPVVRSHHTSPRRVSNKHSVYISPHKSSVVTTPSKKMMYRFNRSPAKDLLAINNMIRMGEKMSGKRILEIDKSDENCESPAKRVYQGSFMRRLQNVNNERQEANDSS